MFSRLLLQYCYFRHSVLQKKLLGPGTYEIKDFVELLDSKPGSVRGVCETRDRRFSTVGKVSELFRRILLYPLLNPALEPNEKYQKGSLQLAAILGNISKHVHNNTNISHGHFLKMTILRWTCFRIKV